MADFSLNLDVERITKEDTLTHLGYNSTKDKNIETILKNDKPVWVAVNTNFTPLCADLQDLFNSTGEEDYLILEIDFEDDRTVTLVRVVLKESEIEVGRELLEVFEEEFEEQMLEILL